MFGDDMDHGSISGEIIWIRSDPDLKHDKSRKNISFIMMAIYSQFLAY